MAYDPNDKADKEIVEGLIAEAVDEATASLKTKNSELLGKLKKAREGNSDPAAVEKLESDLEKSQSELKEAQKALKTLTKERDTLKTASETESAAVRKLIVDQGLTEALVANNVGKQFLPAVKSLLAGKVTVKADGENRSAEVDGKPLGEFVKAWSQGDEGKSFVIAPANGGGGSPGGKAGGVGGSDFSKLSPVERINAHRQAAN